MREQVKHQHIPVKMYRTTERIMIAAPMPGMEPIDIGVEVTSQGRLILHGDVRGLLKEVKELLVDEWSVGVYHRELDLPEAVDAEHANVTYGNGVLLVSLPISTRAVAARVTLERITPTHGEHQGYAGHPPV
ncbi:MAG TPA: Hsp20/alpha crystallin family protein [Ktedonobacteraceae bacterium]|nr:Hsp20/alpha crystallin family protein [Ktedonobacteraceae bacterium]